MVKHQQKKRKASLKLPKRSRLWWKDYLFFPALKNNMMQMKLKEDYRLYIKIP
jgi:hypothetical protein